MSAANVKHMAMNFEMITSKSVVGEYDSPVSLHRAKCAGAKRETQKCRGSIFPLKAQSLEEATREAFVEGGVEVAGWALSDVDVHGCCLVGVR